jgi:hypothetical protein
VNWKPVKWLLLFDDENLQDFCSKERKGEITGKGIKSWTDGKKDLRKMSLLSLLCHKERFVMVLSKCKQNLVNCHVQEQK